MSDTIASLFAKISAEIGVPQHLIRLVSGGKQLEAVRTLADYDIGRDSTVHVTALLHGGAPWAAVLQQLGLQVYRVPGDGLCLWHSIMHQCKACFDIPTLRRDVLKMLTDNAAVWSQSELNITDWNAELTRVELDGKYAGGPTLRALAVALGRDLVVLIKGNGTLNVYPADPAWVSSPGDGVALMAQIDPDVPEQMDAFMLYMRGQGPLYGPDGNQLHQPPHQQPPMVIICNNVSGVLAHYDSTVNVQQASSSSLVRSPPFVNLPSLAPPV